MTPRRQLDRAREYATTHNLTLDDHSYRDLGVSGCKGKNRVEGALGAFIKAVDDGKVPAGSYLVRYLDGREVPTMSHAKHWTQSLVAAILRNPAVYGKFTQKSGGKGDDEAYYNTPIHKSVTNIFSGICYCPLCGSRLRFVRTRDAHHYLECLAAYTSKKGCSADRSPYKTVEVGFIYEMVS